jgi:invasion protein IalB
MTASKLIKISGWFLFSLIQPAAFSQQDQSNITSHSYGDWFVRCETANDEPQSCVMSQQVLAKEGDRQLMQINLAKVEQGVLMTAIFPLGIYLPAGTNLQVDELEKTHFSFEFCTERGCFVNQLLSDELVQLLRKKKTAKFTVAASKDSVVYIPMSITGFLDAFAEL